MAIYHKYIFYRRALQALLIVNMIIISSGLFTGIAFYSSKQNFATLVKQDMERIQKLDLIQQRLIHLTASQQDAFKYRYLLETLKERLEAWPDSTLAGLSIPQDTSKARLPMESITSMFERVIKEKTRLSTEISEATSKLSDISLQLFVVAICTLLFGFILPWILFKRLQKEAHEARIKLEHKISHWIAHWAETYKKNGEQPFKEMTFWLDIVLLSVETFAPKSKHLFFNYILEFAPIFRHEMKKVRDHSESKAKFAS